MHGGSGGQAGTDVDRDTIVLVTSRSAPAYRAMFGLAQQDLTGDSCDVEIREALRGWLADAGVAHGRAVGRRGPQDRPPVRGRCRAARGGRRGWPGAADR